VARGEVASFLISNADFWFRNFHIDGLRVDAVASMLYLDYDRRGGEWIPNIYGDNKNLEAIEFFKKLNGYISREFPDALMIAEESTDFPGVTASVENGLGFSMKWDMGFMNDTLSYMESDPIYRKYSHGRLTFSMIYAFGERYTMPISHDEVVHGKRSLLDKMFGSYDEKFASVRAYMGYMMTHPGKKLMFMGNEIGQFDEWKYDGEIEWFLLDYDKHARLQRYFAEINHFYLENPELWEDDCSWEGFKWIDPDNAELSVLSYRRLSAERRGRRSELYVVLNFTPVKREDYKLYVEKQGRYEEVFNSDREIFGGYGNENLGELEAKKRAYGGYELNITVPPMSVVIFKKKAQRRKS
jgi:1,4-alpha-glucan branching enzyme